MSVLKSSQPKTCTALNGEDGTAHQMKTSSASDEVGQILDTASGIAPLSLFIKERERERGGGGEKERDGGGGVKIRAEMNTSSIRLPGF